MKVLKPRTARLSNGLTVIHLHTERDPVSACHLFIPVGTNQESERQAGLTTLVWSLLLKGTEKRTSRQLAEDIESIGASVGAGATHDHSEISCHAVSEYFHRAMEIMGEVLFHPTHAPAEFEKERAALVAGIRSKKESLFTVANDELNLLLYGKHPYARPSSGVEETVKTFTRNSVSAWHKKMMVPENSVLAIASNTSFDRTMAQVERIFGASAWKKPVGAKPKSVPHTSPLKRPAGLQRHEQFEQAYLLIGFAAPEVKSKEYVPLKILNACLGGGMSARLFQQLREQQGLAYDVGSFYASKKLGSAFVAYLGLQPSKLEEAERRIHNVLEQMRTEKISKEELAETKGFVKGTYILDHQTNSQRAHYLGWWHVLGLPPTYDRDYLRKIDAVTPEQVLKAARKVLGSPAVTVKVIPKKSAPAPEHAK